MVKMLGVNTPAKVPSEAFELETPDFLSGSSIVISFSGIKCSIIREMVFLSLHYPAVCSIRRPGPYTGKPGRSRECRCSGRGRHRWSRETAGPPALDDRSLIHGPAVRILPKRHNLPGHLCTHVHHLLRLNGPGGGDGDNQIALFHPGSSKGDGLPFFSWKDQAPAAPTIPNPLFSQAFVARWWKGPWI
jgi:hypothetical protein